MIVDVKVPSVGESVAEGVLANWTISNGGYVNKGDTLFELDTDKATTDVPAPDSGTVEHVVEEGTEVTIDAVVARINTEGKESSDALARQDDDSEAPASESNGSAPAPSTDDTSASPENERITATPLAKKVAAEKNIDLNNITGTGSGGRITRDDVENHQHRDASKSLEKPFKGTEADKKSAPSAVAQQSGPDQTREKMTMLRRRIAERLVSAQHNAAMLTTFNDVDMSAVMNLRKQYKDQFEKRHGIKLGFMSFFTKAVIEALRDFPLVNAYIDGNEIVHNHRYHIGMAVSTDRGLTVPVIRNADQLGFAEIEKSIREYALKARDGKLALDDLQGGTFTITNGGIFGSMLSTPILNPPQSAILGMHRIDERPIAINGEVVVRPMMYLALSYDHRIIDGKEAVSFLAKIKDCIENPTRMLLDV